MRAFFSIRSGWAVLLLLCTLAVRLGVPAGFMPVAVGGVVTLQLCPGVSAAPKAASVMHGMHHGSPQDDAHAKPEMPCAFAGLGAAPLGAADAALLVAAVLFAFSLAVRASAQLPPLPAARLRPPLRAPPAIV